MEQSDRDMLVRVDESLNGPTGVVARMTALESKIDTHDQRVTASSLLKSKVTWVMTTASGSIGAACAWMARTFLDGGK